MDESAPTLCSKLRVPWFHVRILWKSAGAEPWCSVGCGIWSQSLSAFGRQWERWGRTCIPEKKTSGLGQPEHINWYDFHSYQSDPAASIETYEYAKSLKKSVGIWGESGTSIGDLTGWSVQLLQGKRLLGGHLENSSLSSICRVLRI